ncbi:MAG: polyphosphate--glucose phosphotransferase [Acidimicrobiales bacterium]
MPNKSESTIVFGLDVGGTGIKGAPVDVRAGTLTAERYRVRTPHPATPKNVSRTVKEVVDHFGWSGPLGCTFPAVIKNGVSLTAANVDKRWVGNDVASTFADAIGTTVTVINDADAAGIAEMRFGAGKGRRGVVVMLTLGTGIGSGLFLDGELVPNSELGHIEIDGRDAEKRAAANVRDDEHLSWKRYASRVQRYIEHLDALLWPDLVIIGGGVSRKAVKLLPHIDVRPEVVPAMLQNGAGIVGAALAASASR